MGLTCYCGEAEIDGDVWMWLRPTDFTTLKFKRRKRCCSCNCMIDVGATCLEFNRIRGPKTEIEEEILGDEIEIASWWMCEKCGEIALNLDAIGYCIDLGYDNMDDLMDEYHQMTGFKKQQER